MVMEETTSVIESMASERRQTWIMAMVKGMPNPRSVLKRGAAKQADNAIRELPTVKEWGRDAYRIF